jgi:hypothetical protein
MTSRRDEWNEHVPRLAPEGNVQTIRGSSPMGRRSPARPHRRWSESHSGNNSLVA